MAQPNFLFKTTRGLIQAQALRVRHPDIFKRDLKESVVGAYNVLTTTGKVNTTQFEVFPKGIVCGPDGRDTVNRDRQYIRRTAAAVKDVVRRLRPEEADVLDDLDAQIKTVEAQLAELRAQRIATVKAAWAKAHVVRLNEVENMMKEGE